MTEYEILEPWEAAQLQQQPIVLNASQADLLDILTDRPRRSPRHDCRAPRDDAPIGDDVLAIIERYG
jgi:hypothetical protein